jgi:periplasmic copper chaperone A
MLACVRRSLSTPVFGVSPAMTRTGSPVPIPADGSRPSVRRSSLMPPSLPAIRPVAAVDVHVAAAAADASTIVLRRTILTATALGALVLPAAAAADVTLQPDAAPAGAFARLDVRVPTERGVATKRVVLELPPGFAFASFQPVAGWRIRMSQRELVQPLRIDGTDFDHEIARITWTAETNADAIPPGAFQDFGLAVRIPDGEPGQKLTFKALQEYADGETVRWVGDHTSATPAPQVTLHDAVDPATAATAKTAAAAAPAKATATNVPSQGLVLAAFAAGGLGILMGFAGWLAGRSRV